MRNSSKELMSLLFQIHRKLKQGECANASFKECTMQQLQMLMYVKLSKKVSMKDIAEEMNIRPASVTPLIDKFVDLGWVERLVDEKDRRSIFVQLSKKGVQLFETLIAEKMKYVDVALAKIPIHQVEGLLEGLRSLDTVL